MSKQTQQSPWLSIASAAKYIHVRRETLEKLIRYGYLKAYETPATLISDTRPRTLISTHDLDELVRSQQARYTTQKFGGAYE